MRELFIIEAAELLILPKTQKREDSESNSPHPPLPFLPLFLPYRI